MSEPQIGDHRFAGYSNGDLAGQIDALRAGSGSRSLSRAADALVAIASGLEQTDRTLRQELAKIGVIWEGNAAEGATVQVEEHAEYGESGGVTVTAASNTVSAQSGTFSHTRDSAPESGTLRGPTEESGWDRFAGAFGHTTDHAQQVEQTTEARQQAIATLDDYATSSQGYLDAQRSLPVPPSMSVTSTPPPGPGGGGTAIGVLPGINPTGARPGVPPLTGVVGPGAPGFQPGLLPGPVVPPGSANGPGPRVGAGPFPPGTPGQSNVPGGFRPGFPPALVGELGASTAVVGGSGAIAGAGAEKDRLVRGRTGTPGAPIADGPEGGRTGRPGAHAITTPPEEEARAARAAERLTSKTRPSSGLMHPATGTAREEEDTEHVRKYGIDSGDVFDDERLVVPPVIGDRD